MWVQDTSTTTPSYYPIEFDMGISNAMISNWAGINPDEDLAKYVFTVTDSGSVNIDGNIALTDGPGLGVVWTGADVTTALNSAISAQIISVFGGFGTQTISVADAGGDAERSAASIAAALSALPGVTAHASENSATIIHEVTHQVAFNCGVHTRFNDVPRWVSEGLATMFEAKGVWNSIAQKEPSFGMLSIIHFSGSTIISPKRPMDSGRLHLSGWKKWIRRG